MAIRLKPRTVLTALLVALGLVLGQQAAASAAPRVPSASTATSLAGTAMTAKEYQALKATLDAAPTMHRSVTVVGNVRTFTYVSATGLSLSLQFPVTGKVRAGKLSAGGCGFLQLCIYFNRTDQGAIAAGAAAGLGVLICAVTSPVGCAAAAAVLAIAAYYIDHYGFCRNQLRVRILPVPGSARCV